MKSGTALPIYVLTVFIVWGSVLANNIQNDHSDLDWSLKKALESNGAREGGATLDDNKLNNENSNQGLINTIVNHNNKINNIDNKYKFIINNFANSSHVKEVVEKTRELEQHVFGAPRPHSSWREFLLMLIIIVGMVWVCVQGGRKFVGPAILKYIRKQSGSSMLGLATISADVHQGGRAKQLSTDQLRTMLEQQMDEHNTKFKDTMRILNENLYIGKDPVRTTVDLH